MFSSKEQIGIIKHKIGDKVTEICYNGTVAMSRNRTRDEGTIVYIHPYGRFYTVEFNYNGNRVRESYTVRSDVNPLCLF